MSDERGQGPVACFFGRKVAHVTIGCQGRRVHVGQSRKSGCLPSGDCHGPESRLWNKAIKY